MPKSRSGDPKSRGRGAKIRVKSGKRSASSRRWLERQLNDPLVAEAKRRGYRSRAAFKLRDLDDKFDLLRGKKRIVDLGAAPGGWAQVVRERAPQAKLVGIDLIEIEPVPGAKFITLDFLSEAAPEALKAALGGAADLVLSDLAPATTGHKSTDHLRTMALCEAAFEFAVDVLAPGGDIVAKVLRGGADSALLSRMQRAFASVKHAKPPSSRKESSEWFVVAKGFKP